MSESEKNSQEKETQFPDLEGINKNIASVQEQLASQQEFNQQLVTTLQELQRQRQEAYKVPEENIVSEESFYDLDPKEYRARLREEILQEVSQTTSKEQQKAAAVARIVSEYPEANESGSPLQKEILKQLGKLPKSIQGSAEGYEIAAQRAATQLKVLPKSFKKETSMGNDDFSVSQGRGESRSQRKEKNELDQKTIDTASLMGLDVSDPKVLERLKKRNERRNYGRYE